MARAKRRGGRGNTGSQESPSSQDLHAGHGGDAASNGSPAPTENGAHRDLSPGQEDKDDERCPACQSLGPGQDKESEPESWVRCDACKEWFHWRCAGKGDLEAIDKWYCRPCLDADPKRVITMKPPTRKSSRKKTQRDYAGLHAGQESDPGRWLRMMEGKDIKPHTFKRMKGEDLTVHWLENNPSAMTEPILIEEPDGLGMKMPSEDFGVADVAEIVGEDTPVEVIDVATQSNVPGWTLQKWADYFDTEPAKRDKIRNVISLEISGTELADNILPPRLVREVDWVEKFWPSTKKGRGHNYPKDWHIDFAGSSVYYHILHGEKVFYFIRPTPSNLAAYERWSGTEMQNHSWLGDMCDDVYKVELKTGNTMIIPTGWIHAVYTPKDTLVFGGNFLHSYNVATQLKVRDIEIATHVPKKFRFPYFSKLCWYAGEKYLRDLKAKEEFPTRVLESVESLADFLVSEARAIERGTEQAKKEAKEQVPSERVKDPGAIARELRWRVKFASGYTSDDDTSLKRKGKVTASNSVASVGEKRKRVVDEDDEGHHQYRNFKPRPWDKVREPPAKEETGVLKRKRTEDVDAWVGDEELGDEEGVSEEVTIRRRTYRIERVRKTAKGLERQRIERVTENWEWCDESKPPPVSSSIRGDATTPLPATVNGANGSHGESMREEEDKEETPPVPMETETAA